MIIWDDSQEHKVDFRAPSPPSDLGFHAISPNLPDITENPPTSGWMPNLKSQSGGDMLAKPVPTTPPKRTGGDPLSFLKFDKEKLYNDMMKPIPHLICSNSSHLV